MHRRILVGTLLLLLTGCINVPLRNYTVGQARTVSDLYQLQVLNNLAMFVNDRNSLPHFSYANQGATGVLDTGSVSLSPGWGPGFAFSGFAATFGGSRTGNSNFTMTPVNDPRKLELMRCAYQKVIAACCGGEASTNCPDCQTRFKVFYTGNSDGIIRDSTSGIVTSECIGQSCWFGWGCKKCVPKNCDCSLVGQYCGTYVWVMPGCRDELTKLTLVVLDCAQNNPPQQAQKTVEYYLDERGLPTTFHQAVTKVTAQIGVTENNLSLLSQPQTDEIDLRGAIETEMADIKSQIDDAQVKNQTHTLDHLLPIYEQLGAKKKYLDLQLKAPGLKEQYRQGIVPPAGPSGVLLLDQSLKALTSPGQSVP